MTAQEHPVFIQPENPNISIWRYMDFTKFVSMLDHGGLFFSRADLLGDPFEGAIPKPNIEYRHNMLKSFLPSVSPDSQKKLAESIDGINNSTSWITQRLRLWTYISCWHISEHESAAMWKLYSYSSEAICIKSTYKILKDILPSNSYFGAVTYIDYEKDIIPSDNIFWPFVFKRKSFTHEQEVRAMTFDLGSALQSDKDQADSGVWEVVDLKALIQQVYVAPNAPVWFKDLIKTTIGKFGFKFSVQQSSLDAKPLW